MDKKRLRRWLLLFFLALLLPAALLIQQSYSRLKWETFHQYQKMASELSQRIDKQLTRLIASENKRTFSDYAFLSGGDEKSNLIQRSVLSNFPVESDIPGVIAYFQVDSAGKLTTPLVPPLLGNNDERYGVDASELSQRLAVRNQLQQVLVANQLVTEIRSEPMEAADSLQRSASVPLLEESLEAELMVPEGIAFDQLKQGSRQIASKHNSDRVEDLSLAKSARRSKPVKKQKLDQQVVIAAQSNSVRISTFESEIDPFEFSLLDSGHFVLFRKVWLNGQRYTQGLLIDQAGFLSLIRDEFLNTNLSQMSSALIAFQESLLSTFTSQATSKVYPITRQEMTGEQLFQVRLSDPLSDLQITYSVTDLPTGSGGQLILWLSLIMASVLLGGFYLMYRLGLRQIKLAHQQQDFVSAVSHELKTPLTSIRMYGEILKQGWASEEKKRSYYDFIYDESERLSRLINNVLQLARMDRNEQLPELSPCNVHELVRDIQSKITSQLEMANFELTIEIDESLRETAINIDRDWLLQIMINLVDNAVKFSAKAERKALILGLSKIDKNNIALTVSDFGPGIDKQQMKAIFELFYRSENELTRDTVGTGIGLSLVHQMVTGMGGKVSVKNREPNAQSNAKFPGATFCVSFPIAK